MHYVYSSSLLSLCLDEPTCIILRMAPLCLIALIPTLCVSITNRLPEQVREYAVHCLDQLTDRELSAYLLQLVQVTIIHMLYFQGWPYGSLSCISLNRSNHNKQVLKYEPKHFSPLAHWLLMRALHAQMQIGNAFFWHLRAEMHGMYYVFMKGIRYNMRMGAISWQANSQFLFPSSA